MAAPALDQSMSMEKLREELVWSRIACEKTPHAQDQAPLFEALEEQWWKVYRTQCTRWDAQTAGDIAVTLADDHIDERIDDFDRTLLGSVEHDRTDPHYELYFDVRPSELKRPVLGPELEAVRAWLPALDAEESPDLKGFHKVFAAAVALGDDALALRQQADTANRQFRETGELAKFWREVLETRDRVSATLEKRRVDNPKWKLTRDFATSVFRSLRKTESEEVRKGRIEARAKARQEAQALAEKKKEARQKLAEARKALKALGG